MLEINVRTNLPDFKLQLARFSADFQRKTVKSALSAAAAVYKKLAVAKAPVLNAFTPKRKKDPRIPGNLRKAIYSTRSRSKSRAGVETYFVSFRRGLKGEKRDAFYGRFLELGWQPRGPGHKLRGGDKSRALQRARNFAAGAKRYRYAFLEPAFQQGGAAAIRAFTIRIEKRIAQENQKT